MEASVKNIDGRRKRRYRVAVYAVCRSAREVDTAFDKLIELMLSERRESYLWGVMLDHAPSPLFRTFGDREIEERVRWRFTELCKRYPECGFFATLRGRRYSSDRCFRCENGLRGALLMLASGRDEGFSLRLTTGDTLERSDRMFVYGVAVGKETRLVPGVITSSSMREGAVCIPVGRANAFSAKREFIRSLRKDFAENYRVCGWFPLVPPRHLKTEVYRMMCENVARGGARRGKNALGIELAARCASNAVLALDNGVARYVCQAERDVDALVWEAIGVISLYSLHMLDASELGRSLEAFSLAVDCELLGTEAFNPGMLRIVLLLGAELAELMGVYGDAYIILSKRMVRQAEALRVNYESGARILKSPYSPSEMLAFRCEKTLMNEKFRGFTTLRRASDAFLYLFCREEDVKRELMRLLLSHGVGRNGIMAVDGAFFSGNALLLAVCAELREGVFSRLAFRIPEISSCSRIPEMLPNPCDGISVFPKNYRVIRGLIGQSGIERNNGFGM